MAPIALSDVISSLPTDETWGPPTTSEKLVHGVPYAPYSKGDKLGRMADWTSEGKDKDGRGGRQQYNRNYRDQTVYGAGTSSIFAVQSAEDESSFSVVDNTRTSNKTRGFGRGGGTVFRGRGRGAPAQRGRGAFQRVGGRGGQQGQYYDNRGGRGRGGRRFGWKDYDKPQRNREFSVNIKPDWNMLEEIDFNRLLKLHLPDTGPGEDLESCGFLNHYDRSYDKQSAKKIERRLNVVDRLAYNVTTSSDPVIQELAERDSAAVYATDSILAALMCAPRSVYSWDIVLTRTGNKLFLDKRDGSAVDMVSVNENALDAPLEASEGNKDAINLPGNLADEAATVNHLFAWQTVAEAEATRVDFPRPNPFYNPDSAEERETPLASKAYKYRRYDLTGGAAAPEGAPALTLVVRTELDAVVKNNISGDDQFLTIKALNEFDNKASGGGTTDWRAKLLTQPGAVVATEMKNNSCKLARWTTQSILARADVIKLGFVSRANPKDPNRHVILGAVGYDPRKFAEQMNLSLPNGWAIVRAIADMCLRKPEGKYVLIKDPNKPVLRLYAVPPGTFEDTEEDGAGVRDGAAGAAGAGAEEEGEDE